MIALFAALLAGTAAVAAPTITPAIPLVSQPLGHDDRGRPQIDVSINEQGPFPMIVDTAAQSSLMSPDLAAALKLQPMESDLSINGATGSTKAQIYPVDHFASALFDQEMVGVLMFPNPGTTSARGIVGMEHFGEGKLTFDRTNARLSFGPSAPVEAGYATHKGELQGGLLVVPLTLDGVAIKATVDTGAGVTIANAAALKALGWSADDSRLVAAGTIRGATAAQSAIRMTRIGKMQLGPVSLSNVPVYFNFSGTSQSEPMVILGSDILNLLDAYAVDFPRAELQIRIPGRT
ncbi:hypothetical protein NRB_04990 [Novosphingobium sp. 11B]